MPADLPQDVKMMLSLRQKTGVKHAHRGDVLMGPVADGHLLRVARHSLIKMHTGRSMRAGPLRMCPYKASREALVLLPSVG